MAVCAPVFGWFGAVPILFAGVSYLAWTAYTAIFDFAALGIVLISTFTPLLIGWLAVQRKTGNEETDKVYHELRSKLNSVSGQSDAILNAISNGIIAVNAQNIITLVNPAATKIIGWNREDAIGLDYRTVFKFSDARDQIIPETQHPIQLAHTGGREVKIESLFLVTSDSGKRIQASVTATPLSDGGVITVFRDITEERAEEREQAEFISTASHEMRTPVASIEGFLGLTLNPATAQIDDKARGFILKAHESAQHLGHLFQDLLDVSKADDGRMLNNPQIIDVVPFMHDIISGMLPKAEAKSLFVNFKPNPDFTAATQDVRESYGSNLDHDTARTVAPVFYVNVDSDHLREVADNLIENAIKYTPKGSITVDVDGDDSHVTISVADSGIGIPAEDIPHLFQKFYRVDNSDTREIGGTGLGLYLCRKLAEAMGGKIWVESTYKEGSTFFVQLPRISSVDAQRIIEDSSEKESTVEITNVTSSVVDSDATLEAATAMSQSQNTQQMAPVTQPNVVQAQTAPVATPPQAAIPNAPITPTQQPAVSTYQPAVAPSQPAQPQPTQAVTTQATQPAATQGAPVAAPVYAQAQPIAVKATPEQVPQTVPSAAPVAPQQTPPPRR